ncbi:ABC transporter permease (plasmid) [Roseomonas sp. OT10]|uniref:ABC transporter permease n=1 Tax=Roseomonas cutis TaxID=2897332 RepID=UPI001E4BE5C9|nr:ABC transporter permease [Roseomonas sp. OT10]UFN51530.1 ABC transporter permease [Roseomonas sp. OT10]
MNTFLQILIGGLLQGGVFAMVALGFSLVYRVTGIVNLSQGAFCVLGAMAMYFLQSVLGLPMPLALAGAALATVVIAVLLGSFTLLPAISTLPPSSTLMLTAGLLTFFEGLVLILWGSQPYAMPPFSGEAPVVIGGLRIPSQGLWVIGACAVMIAALWYLLQRTRTGRALRACAENTTAARLMGIDVPRMMLLSLALAAFIGAVTGVTIAPIASMQFDTANFYTTFGFIAVAIGGIGSFVGAVAGGLVLGVATQFAAGYLSEIFSTTLALVLLLAVLVLRPSGLFSAGRAQRTDVRVDRHAHRSIVRFDSRASIALGLALLALLAAAPVLPLPAGMTGSLCIALIVFIAVLGLDVLMGFAGQVSLGQSGFMAIGGYAAAILSATYGLSPFLSILAALLLSGTCAAVLALVTMQLRGHYLALATLAFALLIDSLAVGLVDLTGGPSGFVGIPVLEIGPVAFDTTERMYYLILAVVVLLVLLFAGGLRSGFGRALMSVRADQAAASALGMRVGYIKVVAMVLSALLGSLSGSLYAFQFQFLSPDMVSTMRSFQLIAMLVLGGEATLIGGFLGVVLLTLLPTLFQPLATYRMLAEGALLVLVFRFLPEGLYGRAVMVLDRAWPVAPSPGRLAARETRA